MQGLNQDNKPTGGTFAIEIVPFINNIAQFLGRVSGGAHTTSDMKKQIVGVLGDTVQALAAQLPSNYLSMLRQIVTHEFARNVIAFCCESEDSSTRETGQWAHTLVTNLVARTQSGQV